MRKGDKFPYKNIYIYILYRPIAIGSAVNTPKTKLCLESSNTAATVATYVPVAVVAAVVAEQQFELVALFLTK